MSSQQQIRHFADTFQKESNQLDILINNAGVLLNERQESEDGIEMTFAINTLGYFLLTNLLRPMLAKSPQGRIINVSSGGMYTAKIHVDDLQYEQRTYNGVQAYAETKRAEVILTQIWAQKVADTNIVVAAMHPGWANTKGVQDSLPLFQTVMRPLLRSSAQGGRHYHLVGGKPTVGKSRERAILVRSQGPFYPPTAENPKHATRDSAVLANLLCADWL